HNGQLQVIGCIHDIDERNKEAAKSAIVLVAYYLIGLGYLLGLKKSVVTPSKVVPYLGFLCDSSREVFDIIPAKRQKFLDMVWGAAGSKVDSYVGKLRATFHEIGRDGEWDKRLGLGNLAADKTVKDYLRLVTAKQLQARITPN
ncbi:hypothetical protein QZH41_013774, partial [Actinostola sp. cb2023]